VTKSSSPTRVPSVRSFRATNRILTSLYPLSQKHTLNIGSIVKTLSVSSSTPSAITSSHTPLARSRKSATPAAGSHAARRTLLRYRTRCLAALFSCTAFHPHESSSPRSSLQRCHLCHTRTLGHHLRPSGRLSPLRLLLIFRSARSGFRSGHSHATSTSRPKSGDPPPTNAATRDTL
jgi:hypothetical protein